MCVNFSPSSQASRDLNMDPTDPLVTLTLNIDLIL